jgi:hypothetical protein
MNFRWWRRRSKPADRCAEEIQKQSGLFEGWTDEEITEFYRFTRKEPHKRRSQLLAELSLHEWGSPEHREAAYRIHCLNVAIRNEERIKSRMGTGYLVPRKEFEKHYYGNANNQ